MPLIYILMQNIYSADLATYSVFPRRKIRIHKNIYRLGKDLIYFPKVKYYYISVSATQTEFTNDCSKTQYVTFNFNFESRVSALKASVLDTKTSDYTKFKAALDKAQGKLYTDCLNTIDKILDTESKLPTGEFLLGTNINLDNYPRISIS